jgi:hypothetical protein
VYVALLEREPRALLLELRLLEALQRLERR